MGGGGGQTTWGSVEVGLRRSFSRFEKLGSLDVKLQFVQSVRQLEPSGRVRNDSRALGPERSDDWEKRALEHMGGAIWSSLEQFGWDHLGSPGISEGQCRLQDSGSWGQLGDPRRPTLDIVVLGSSFGCLICPLSLLVPFFFCVCWTANERSAPVPAPTAHRSSCWVYGPR